MAKKYFLSFLTVLVGLSLASCSLIKNYTNRKSPTSTSTSSQVSQKDSSKSAKASDKEISPMTKTKRIGSADYGYVNIPSDWKKNDSIQVGDNIQYTDKNAFNIIVLNAATREKANVAEGVEFNADLIAQRFETRWKDSKLVEKMTRSTTTVGGNESLKIHIFLNSGLQVAGWVFQKDDKVYLIVVEGFEKTITQFTPYVENTWSLDGTGAVTD